MKNIELLQKMIDESNNIVFFGGAGVSTESGIKDFRSKDGLYNMKYKYPPELILSSAFFYEKTDEFFKFYKDKLNCLDKKPNIVHNYLSNLEKRGKLKAIVTQNIDGLHTKAGNKTIYELHGTIYRNYCTKCSKSYDAEYVFKSKGIPLCECGGIIKPAVVLFGEALPNFEFNSSIDVIKKADMLIVAGTSLTVFPANTLINYFNGKYLVIINKSTTDFDNKANLVINENMKKIFSELH